MANVGYLIPVVAVLVGGFFLGESIGIEKLVAMVLIITSVILSQRFAVRLKRKQPE
jgi:drug/metabolite transporter (DMT)-like permease